jgi:DNA (cytosine-5)-methyltransferase 1
VTAIIDLFAGPGGWDVAAHALGLEPLGVEWDDAACATRAAAGLRTLQGDVGALAPAEVLAEHFGGQPLWGLIASPPCQAFSMAGKGAGRAAIDDYRDAIALMADDQPVDWAELGEACGDERAHLVLEPLRWALALRPRWIACEQVDPVLPLWHAMADVLRPLGYSTWAGTVSTERYGVPQTRKRAILLASLDGPVTGPAATHQRYIAPRRKEEASLALFDAPEPERIVHVDDRGLLPWISMAEALGWGMTASPAGPVVARHGGEGAPHALDGGSSQRERMAEAMQDGQWIDREGRGPGDSAWSRSRVDVAEAAILQTFEPPSWVVDTGNTRSGSRPDGRWRRVGEPAPTITTRADQLEWRPPTHYDSRGQRDGRTGEPNRRRSIDEPAPTIAAQSRNDSWVFDRPATTVCGDPRIFTPEWRGAPSDYAADGSYIGKRAGDNAIRVTVAQAGALQSFPPRYPWQGTKTKQHEQVGNAVPPLLAWHVLNAVGAGAAARSGAEEAAA